MNIYKLKLLISVLIGIVLLAVFLWRRDMAEERKMSERISSMPMKSVCVGRFVMDVPRHAVVTYRAASIAGWDISVIQETAEEFIRRAKGKENLLALQKNERGGVSIENVRELGKNGVIGKIFSFNRKWIELRRSGKDVVSERVQIDAILRLAGVSYDFTSELRRMEDVDLLASLLNRLRVVSDGDIPQEPGFCFDRSFIADPLTAEQHEYTSLFLGVKEHPDLAVSLSTAAGIRNDRTLLQRDADNDVQREYRSNFHRLRAGARSLNGIPGEEVLQRVHELNGAKLHGFMWESLADKNNVYLPSLSLELDTGLGQPGHPVNSSLSDTEALTLWDKISSSLRLRPVGDQKPTSVASKGS